MDILKTLIGIITVVGFIGYVILEVVNKRRMTREVNTLVASAEELKNRYNTLLETLNKPKFVSAKNADEYDGWVLCRYCHGEGKVREERDPIGHSVAEVLDFLAGRMEYAGISDLVAKGYARDIRMLMEGKTINFSTIEVDGMKKEVSPTDDAASLLSRYDCAVAALDAEMNDGWDEDGRRIELKREVEVLRSELLSALTNNQ